MARYSYTTGNRWFMLAIFAVGAAFGVAILIGSLVSASGPPLLFMLAWFGALAWNMYWWLWRISYRFEVDGDRLRWMTPLRGGEVRVADVEAVRLGWFGQTTVIELRDNDDLTCLTRTGISEFAQALTGESVPVPIFERLGGFGGSAFERER